MGDIICDKTNQPIVGVRYHKTGEDYDLCEAEFQKLSPLDQAAFERIEKPQKPRCFQAAFPLFRFVQYPTDTVMARSTPEVQLQVMPKLPKQPRLMCPNSRRLLSMSIL